MVRAWEMQIDAVLVLGESVVDVVRRPDAEPVDHPGGSAANVAVALARLGRAVRLATALAHDLHGELIAGHLAAEGVELFGDPYVLPRTSSAVATIGPDGAASYDFDLDWRLGPLPDPHRPIAVHLCSLGAILEPGAVTVLDMVRRMRASGILVSYDVNARPAITGTGPAVVAAVERAAGHAHLVKASDEDLAALWPDLPLAAAADHLLRLGPAAVIVTRGGAGSTWYDAEKSHQVPAPEVAVVDTIGAGDTFSAALLDRLWRLGLLSSWDTAVLERDTVTDLLTAASRAAAVTVSRAGADPPHRADLD